MNITLEELEKHCKAEMIQSQELIVLTPEAHLLLIFMHHGGDDRFTSLKHIYDIATLLQKHEAIDWKWLFDKARRFNIEKLVYIGVNLASALTGIKIPDEIRAFTTRRRIKRLTENRLRSIMKPLRYRSGVKFNFDNWLFRIRSRTGMVTRISITIATFKALLSNPMKPAEQ